jgi:hypothetical protein
VSVIIFIGCDSIYLTIILVSTQGRPQLMNRRAVDSAFYEFRINYEDIKDQPIKKHSSAFSAGGQSGE